MSSSGKRSETELEPGTSKQLEEQSRYLQAISSISNVLAKELDTEHLLKGALERIVEATGATSGVVYTHREDGMWELAALQNLTEQVAYSYNLITDDYPGIKLVLDSEDPVTFSEWANEPSRYVSEWNKQHGVQSWAAVKIRVHGTLFGILGISSQDYNAFNGTHLQVMGVIGHLMSLALSNAAAHQMALMQINKQLRERVAVQESVLASMSNGLLICDKEGRIVLANSAAEHITEMPMAQLIGQSVLSENWNRSPDESEVQYEPGDGPLVRAILYGQESKNCYIQTTVGDQSCVLSLSASPFRMEGQDLGGVVVVMRDITEEWQAQQSNEEFLSILSHELRAPLTVISGYAQFLSRKLAKQDMDDDRQSADLIREHALRMSGMIGDVVESGRLESGMRGMEKEPTDLAELVGNVVRRINAEQRYTKKEPQHTIVVSLPEDLPKVRIDKGRIDQVLTNLLANAVKYGPNGGEIAISVAIHEEPGHESGGQPTPRSLLISVTDQGIGVPPEERARIFERGFRGGRAKDLSAQGLGLGLYICRLAVEAHGGRIGVKDGPDGRGSLFWLTLPVVNS